MGGRCRRSRTIAAPLGAHFLAAIADEVGAEPGSLDAVLVAPAEVTVALVPTTHR